MRVTLLIAVPLLALALGACDNAGDAQVEPPTPPAEDTSSAAPAGTAGERAREALGEAGDAARETVQSIGEAGKAGIEALQENAPEIRQNIGEAAGTVRDAAGAAGERVRNAAGELMEGTGQPDAPGDSEADANETPEAAEPAQ
jgi:hypothetical protein